MKENKEDVSVKRYYETLFIKGMENVPPFDKLNKKQIGRLARSHEYTFWRFSISIRHFSYTIAEAAEGWAKAVKAASISMDQLAKCFKNIKIKK